MTKNGEVVQQGNTEQLSFSVLSQIWEMHKVTHLQQGDVIMTGTPSGVGATNPGDKLELKCEKLGIDYKVDVVAESKL